jgi:hypothetical protein
MRKFVSEQRQTCRSLFKGHPKNDREQEQNKYYANAEGIGPIQDSDGAPDVTQEEAHNARKDSSNPACPTPTQTGPKARDSAYDCQRSRTEIETCLSRFFWHSLYLRYVRLPNLNLSLADAAQSVLPSHILDQT